MNSLYGYGPATAAAREIIADLNQARTSRTQQLHRRHLEFLALIYEVDPAVLQQTLRRFSDTAQPFTVS